MPHRSFGKATNQIPLVGGYTFVMAEFKTKEDKSEVGPLAGQIAMVRQRNYLVESVVQPTQAADSTLVRLSCVDDDAQGQPLEVLWELEIDTEIRTGEAGKRAGIAPFDRLVTSGDHGMRVIVACRIG